MIVSPALAGLRRDPAPQLAAQRALEDADARWRCEPPVARVLAELERYGAGLPLESCPALKLLVGQFETARALVAGFVTRQAAVLREHPLGHVPLRYQHSGGILVLQLASTGRAVLSLLSYAPHGGPLATTVCFVGGERHELCLAGSADVRFFSLAAQGAARADLTCEMRRVTAGDSFGLTGPDVTKIVDRPDRRFVVLRVARGEAEAVPAREYRIADGALVHTAAGDRAESRDEMAAAVLGAMQRSDAVPVIAEMARSGSDHLRWQALRQALALDTATGFALLSQLADADRDTLRTPAKALRTALLDRHPELQRLA